MRIIDAHSHINIKAESPMRDLLSEMDANNVERSLLILNLPEERDCFMKEYDVFLSNKERFALSYGLDFHNPKSKRDLDTIINKIGDKVVIKIHPKLFKIVREDIEHHFGVELSVALAIEYRNRHIIVAHSGSLDFLKCMMSCRYMPHVYFDYSFIQSFFNQTSLRIDMVNFLKRTSNRIMFGSDRPSFKIKNTIDDILSIAKEADISESQLDDVLYGNALKMFW